MRERIVVWQVAPNRHFEPLLEAAARARVLEHVYYGAPVLEWQLGTRPAVRSAVLETVVPASRQGKPAIRDLVRHHRDACHLVVSFAAPFTRTALAACAHEGIRHWIWAEALQPRSILGPKRIARSLLYRACAQRVDGAFALSRSAALDLCSLGIPRERIYPAMFPGPDYRLPYSRPHSERVVFCGRLIDLKGIDLLCRALRDIGSHRPGIGFDVIGEGPALRHLESLRGSTVDVRVHGSVPSGRVPELMSDGAVVVLATRRLEGWGYVVNEAVAAARPVVVSSVVGAGELVVPGRTGAVFPQEDVDRLGDALTAALDLHARPAELAVALDVMQRGTVADAFFEYVLGALTRRGAPPAPWLAAADALGGNEASAWWRQWRGDGPHAGSTRRPDIAAGVRG